MYTITKKDGVSLFTEPSSMQMTSNSTAVSVLWSTIGPPYNNQTFELLLNATIMSTPSTQLVYFNVTVIYYAPVISPLPVSSNNVTVNFTYSTESPSFET